MTKLRPVKTRILFPLLTLLLVWAVVEAIVVPLGLLVPAEFRDRQLTLFSLLEQHRELGFRARPNLRNFEVNWRQNSLSASYNTDELGFRNVGRSYEESEIFFIGDSFTWGMWLPREEIFPDLVGRWLGKTVSNLGQQSYYIEQYEKVARMFLARARPRYVALCIFANDLTTPISDADIQNFYKRFGWNRYRSLPLYRKLFAYRLGEWIAQGVDRVAMAAGLRPPPPPSHLDREIDARGMEFYRQLGAHPYYFSESYNVEVEAVFRRILQFILGENVTPVVFLLPSKESAYKDTYRKLFPGNYLEIEETGYQRLCDIAASLDVVCVDLTAAFRRRNQSADTYFKLDPHWNREGHRLAAEEMSKYLR